MRKTICKILIIFILTPFLAHTQVLVTLDQAVENGAHYLTERFPKGTRAAFIVIKSENPEISEHVYTKLSTVLVNGGWFTVVERNAAALTTIAREMERHLNYEVSQETELSIGRQLGAEIIISGSLNRNGQNWRLELEAQRIESAERAAHWLTDVRTDPAWASLALSRRANLVFTEDTLVTRDRQTIINGLRNIMRERSIPLELDGNSISQTGYSLNLTIYIDRPPANPDLFQAEVIAAFLRSGQELFQTGPYFITETSEVMIARRISERLREDQVFFNKVNEALR